MIILIGNQKGGTGKSTVTLLLANYLVYVKKRRVRVIDMDEQQQLLAKVKRAMVLENKPGYLVLPGLGHTGVTPAEVLSHQEGEIVLIDMSCRLSDEGIPLITRASMVLCPFAYDEFSMQPTLVFAIVLRKVKPDIPFVFIPNRIKSSVNYGTKLEADKALQTFGGVTPGLADKIDFQRITTFHTPASLQGLTLPVLDLIYEHYIVRYENSGAR